MQVVVDEIWKTGEEAKVQAVIGDFEAAVWKAVGQMLPHVEMCGCAFHWGQAVWRHVQQLGLQTAYHNDATFNSYCRQLFALPCSVVLTTGQTGHWPGPPSCWGPPTDATNFFTLYFLKNLHTFLSTERVNDSHVTSYFDTLEAFESLKQNVTTVYR